MTKKLVLVDGSSYLFRAYHALPPLTNSKGTPTGAVYGVINMLRKLIQDEKPDYIGVIFDTKSKNFRHELYPAYKANRPTMPDELSVQIEPLHSIIRAMGLPLLAIEGLEADDVIATLAHQATEKHITTIISTGDKDLAQLVDKNVTLVNTMSGSVLDEKGVVTKFGVRPDQIVDYLTLMGDPVDNVPGIPKVGPKTAAKWIEEHGSLDNIIKNADSIKGKVGEYLRQHLEELPLSRKLVTVQRDAPLDVLVEELIPKSAANDELIALFTTLEFKTWLRQLQEGKTTDGDKNQAEAQPLVNKAKGSYEIILEENMLLPWLNRLSQAKKFAIDTETTSLDPLQAELVGISFAVEEGLGAYIPLTHAYNGAPLQLPRDFVLEKLKPILEDPTIVKIGQNIKYDLHVFSRYGITLQNASEDTMLQSYVFNSVITRHDMDSLAKLYLQYETIPYEAVAGKGAKQITFDKVDVYQAAEYAAEDADITLRLYNVLSKKLESESALNQVYKEIEVPLIEVLWQMEANGICVDARKLEAQSEQIAKTLSELEEQAYILAGETFNLGSPKQLQQIFFEKLQLPIIERTPKGVPSTAESVLQELSHDYELPRLILTHRTLSKLKSTYADKLPQQINPCTHRVHTSYQQAVAATGRLSSTDPNLQNIPIRTEEGRKIRQAFVPETGNLLISADYSQIELRIMAHLSQDEGLLSAFCNDQDIHRFTASEVLGIPMEEVTSEQRRSAKAINFGLIYGMSAFGLARQLGIERSAAQAYMDQYFLRYPGVKKYMESIRESAAQKGYVETLFGRRLYLPDIRAKNVGRRRAAERTAINAPMQGTAADIIKKAMIKLHNELRGQNDIKLLMQVHDELVLEVKPHVIEKAKSLVMDCMQNAAILSVPLVVDLGVGKNWDEAH
ncbi:MAG: DNA polymerase I [Gammaproteobacteria bacterium 39-13]|nr:DNA polymerase I [Gammaproteobacteria bacterium]OJV86205.1 MAG: DNA polymerase I [Gammaproteobacteria bacterium 39-13]